MAPLNTDKVNEDEVEITEDAVDSLNNIGELSGAYGLLTKTEFVCRKRNSASHSKLWGVSDMSKSHIAKSDKDSVQEIDDFKDETCAKCEQNKSEVTVYHNQKEHAHWIAWLDGFYIYFSDYNLI